MKLIALGIGIGVLITLNVWLLGRVTVLEGNVGVLADFSNKTAEKIVELEKLKTPHGKK